jgi:hypothetical protein
MVQPERPWSVPVVLHEIPESGRHLEIVADENTRAAVARLAGLRSLPRLQASFDLSRRGADGLHVAGTVSAGVGQTCVVTLEPMESEVAEAVDLTFVAGRGRPQPEAGAEVEVRPDSPEPLSDGVVDLGMIATEFLVLGIDPYPRRPGAVFERPAEADDPATHPFAALAALKKDPGGSGR